MNPISLTLAQGLVQVMHAVFTTAIDDEQPIVMITLSSDDNQAIDIILNSEVHDGEK